MAQIELDPVSIVIELAAYLFSDEMARIVGTYAVIWVCSTVGAYYALGARDTLRPSSRVVFFLVVSVVALLLTVPLAMLGAAHLPADVDDRWLFAPMALCIGLVGDRWPRIGVAVWRWLRQRFFVHQGVDP